MKRKESRARKCEFCQGKLSTIAHTDALGQMYLICLTCGWGNTIGRSNCIRTSRCVDSKPVMVGGKLP